MYLCMYMYVYTFMYGIIYGSRYVWVDKLWPASCPDQISGHRSHVLKILLNLAYENYHSDVVSIIVKHHPELVTLANTSGMTCAQIAASIKVLNALKDKVSWKVTITKVDFPASHVEAHYGQIKFVREMLTKVPVIVHSEPPDSGGADASNNDTGPEDGYRPLHLRSQLAHEVCFVYFSTHLEYRRTYPISSTAPYLSTWKPSMATRLWSVFSVNQPISCLSRLSAAIQGST